MELVDVGEVAANSSAPHIQHETREVHGSGVEGEQAGADTAGCERALEVGATDGLVVAHLVTVCVLEDESDGLWVARDAWIGQARVEAEGVDKGEAWLEPVGERDWLAGHVGLAP